MPKKKETALIRKPGGQPGNTNALKHGLFAGPNFHPTKITDITIDATPDLTAEIILMRTMMQRVINTAKANEDEASMSELCQTLNTLGIATVRTATLMRTQEALRHRAADMATLICEAIHDIEEEQRNNPDTLGPDEAPSSWHRA